MPVVLLGSDVPSVLVEAGFITNREENGRLRERDYQRKIAEGIYAGLNVYMDDQTTAALGASPAKPQAVAAIAVALRSLGQELSPDFGVAPSTLRHEESSSGACAR